ncbi:MAG: O-antigen ligase family protein [Deltaproteobacteria bacterium]|nr:O-antigen ligase family protein [Deltaproteobacteria bacterium]
MPSIYPSKQAAVPAFFLVSALLLSFFFNGQKFYAFLGTQTCLILALAGALWFAYEGKEEIKVSAVTFLMLVLALWLFISTLWSRIPYLSIITAWWLAVAALACGIFLLTPRKGFLYAALLGAAFVSGGLQGLLALYQFFVLETLPNGLFLYKNLLGSFLVLLVFLLCGLFFILPEEKKSIRYLLLTFLFFLTFVVDIIQSRGVFLSLFLSMLLFFAIARYLKANRRTLVTLLVTLVLAFVCAELVSLSATLTGLSQRVMSLENPFAAGKDRFLIWQGCLEMIRDYPWWGTGLGTYWLLWPPYRSPLDTSGGYYAHNDYLQFWIEGGIPLLIILLGLMSVIAVAFYRTMNAKELPQANKIEALSLFAGLMALAIHTVTDFNFYNMPTMILAGVMLGRLDMLSATRKWRLVLPECLRVRTGVYRTCLMLASFTLLSFFLCMGLSYYYCEQGNELFAKMNHAGAARSYDLAGKLWSSYDKPLYSRAYLLGSVMKPAGNDAGNSETRREIYVQAREYLKRAEKLNPYQPRTYLTRALLEESMGAEMNVIAGVFEKALQVDPLFLKGRTEYGRYLAQSGQSRKALAILEAGMVYYYHPGNPELIPYYQLTSILRRQSGYLYGAAELDEKIAVIKEESRKARAAKKRDWLF